jgi:mycothiol system anti-sigma-R factor
MSESEPGCTKVRELCSDYVDGELDVQATRHMASHLDECGPCQALIDTLKATIALLRTPQHRRAPDSLRASVKQRIRGIQA